MEHAMRKKERQLSQQEAEDILRCGAFGILSTCAPDGEPYGTPLSYVYEEGKIYFHCAPMAGHKLENIASQPRVCFTVVTGVKTLPEKFSTLYASAIAFGTAALSSDDEKRRALRALIAKYSPDYKQEGEAYIARAFGNVAVYAIQIDRLTAKGRRPSN